ncbi:MAG TPA: hypothetical protein PKA28_20155, partial [Methylomusa anaerophila]|uniref:hypothetical protein n=1 Tax=Methylomusa anaerophila TaxID=1930071 RepID=UPI002BD29852
VFSRKIFVFSHETAKYGFLIDFIEYRHQKRKKYAGANFRLLSYYVIYNAGEYTGTVFFGN